MAKMLTWLGLFAFLSVAVFISACSSSDSGNTPPAKEWDSAVFCPRVGINAHTTYLAIGTYAVLDDGRMVVWGSEAEELFWDQRTASGPHEHQCFYPLLVPLVEHAKSVVPGGSNGFCILKDDDTVSCWNNEPVSLIDPQQPEKGWESKIQSVAGATGIVQLVGTGSGTFLALRNDGMVLSFGVNDNPKPVGGLTAVKAISVGGFNTATLSDGTVMKWSGGSYSCVFPSTTSPDGYRKTTLSASGTPTLFAGLSDVALTDTDCAIHNDGSLSCWDCQSLWLFWSGPDTDYADMVPAKVKGVTDVLDVAMVESQSRVSQYALTKSGDVMHWGVTQPHDQPNTINPPEVFATIPGAKQIVGGDGYACVLLNDGKVQCWGDNSNGELGNGTTEAAEKPVAIVW
ncbi:MAG: hypothetical protein WCW31_02175 [Patescibacteria group bacterium]